MSTDLRGFSNPVFRQNLDFDLTKILGSGQIQIRHSGSYRLMCSRNILKRLRLIKILPLRVQKVFSTFLSCFLKAAHELALALQPGMRIRICIWIEGVSGSDINPQNHDKKVDFYRWFLWDRFRMGCFSFLSDTNTITVFSSRGMDTDPDRFHPDPQPCLQHCIKCKVLSSRRRQAGQQKSV